MAYSVVISEPVERDLDRAVGYIAEALCAPRAARDLLDEFERLLGVLSDNCRTTRTSSAWTSA